MNKRFLLGCSIATLGLVAISFYSYNKSGDKGDSQVSSASAKDAIQELETTKNTVNNKRVPTLHKKVPPPSEINALLVKNDTAINESIWSNKAKNHNTAPPQYSHFSNDGVDRAYINIQRLEIEALDSGSHFMVNIPQTGNTFKAVVNNVGYHSNGDKRVTATIDDGNNEPYTVTMTQGENATFGTFSTPDGVYVLEAGSTDGWLASKNDLINIQDRTVSDEVHVIPDDSDLPPSS